MLQTMQPLPTDATITSFIYILAEKKGAAVILSDPNSLVSCSLACICLPSVAYVSLSSILLKIVKGTFDPYGFGSHIPVRKFLVHNRLCIVMKTSTVENLILQYV